MLRNKSIQSSQARFGSAKWLFHDLITENPELDQFVATKVDGDALDNFLWFLYTGKIRNEDDVNVELLRIAQKYSAEELKSFCENQLAAKINKTNVIENLLLAIFCDCKIMKETSYKIIADNYQELQNSDGMETILSDPESSSGILNRLGIFLNVKMKCLDCLFLAFYFQLINKLNEIFIFR